MKITYKEIQKQTYFSNLAPGDIFKLALDGVPFLKTTECESSNHNAVNLMLNCTSRVDPGIKVIPIDCELIVK